MEYLSYSDYAVAYNENIDEKEFNRLSGIAKSSVDFYTFNRIDYVTKEVKACMGELIHFLENSFQDGKEITTEKVANYSVTYANVSKDKEVRDIIKRHLLHTGLMYRGASYDRQY